MGNRGGNKGRASAGRGDNGAQNARDQAVHRDPDIGGIFRRTSHGPHMRSRTWEFLFNPFRTKKK